MKILDKAGFAVKKPKGLPAGKLLELLQSHPDHFVLQE